MPTDFATTQEMCSNDIATNRYECTPTDWQSASRQTNIKNEFNAYSAGLQCNRSLPPSAVTEHQANT
eukprot:14099745-Alexandrium_andersonii.AAC.1